MALDYPPPAARKPPAKRASSDIDKVRIIALPTIIFFYPTMVIGLIAGISMAAGLGGEVGWSLAFTIALVLNLIVLSFDFARSATLSLLFLGVAVVLGAILLNQQVEFLPSLADAMRDLEPVVNAEFLLIFSISLLVIMLIATINRRFFNYWEVFSNELLHHHGLLGDLERWPAPGVRLEKEIDDIFEFLLFVLVGGCGRLIITPQQGSPIVLDNVLAINRVERELKSVLKVTEVEINQQ